MRTKRTGFTDLPLSPANSRNLANLLVRQIVNSVTKREAAKARAAVRALAKNRS
jgi:hypothetical protein